MASVSDFLEILRRPAAGDVMPIWVAVLVGILVGWAWKPKWARFKLGFLEKPLLLFPQLVPSWISVFAASSSDSPDYSSSEKTEKGGESSVVVNGNDLRRLHNLVEEKDGGPAWIQMMDRSTSDMSYQAWRRDPENGPPQYRSRTIYEDATPELLRDFFWDDEFRTQWDDMLLHAETLEECPNTGSMVVQWVRKFPFFCSDREYIIGRRIWESGRKFYCVTKGVPCTSVPRRTKPIRVDLYYSSWCIRAAESKRDGRLTACEVTLFHHEDMGIPWEIAKLGVRQGMWGAVKKIVSGLRAYQKHRAPSSSSSSTSPPLSRSALMAQVNTKVSVDYLEKEEEEEEMSEMKGVVSVKENSTPSSSRRCIPKMLVLGGAIALACTLDQGLLTKAVIFGVARRFAKTGGKRL